MITVIADFAESRVQIVADAKSPTRVWMTRRDLHDWVWHRPLYVLNAMLGGGDVSVSYICRAFGIDLPSPGIWRSLRAGRTIPRDVFPDTPEALDPIPLGPFESNLDNSMRTLRCQLQLRPEQQLAGPGPEDRPWPSDRSPTVSPAVQPDKRVRIGHYVEGPPKRLKQSRLRRLLRNPNVESRRYELGLYGIGGGMFLKLLQYEDLASFPTLKRMSSDDLSGIARFEFDHTNYFSELLPFSRAQSTKTVNLSPDRRASLQAEFEAELAGALAWQAEVKALARVSYEARREKVAAQFDEVIIEFAEGADIDVILYDRHLDRASFQSAIVHALRKCADEDLQEDVRRIKRGLRGHADLHPADAVLLLQLLATERRKSIKWLGWEFQCYGKQPLATQQRGLAEWIASAAAAKHAGAAEPLAECRDYLAARESGPMAQIRLSKKPSGLRTF